MPSEANHDNQYLSTMKLNLVSVFLTIILMLILKSSHSMEVSRIPTVLLKPLMLTNKWYFRSRLPLPFNVLFLKVSYIPTQHLYCIILFFHIRFLDPFSLKDYVCTLSPEEKDELCRRVFGFEYLQKLLEVNYSDSLSKNNYNFDCENKTFNCFLNNYFGFGLTQAMLLCPIAEVVDGKEVQIEKYFVSTNYTSGRVIVFEESLVGDVKKVAAVVGLYDIDLLALKPQN